MRTAVQVMYDDKGFCIGHEEVVLLDGGEVYETRTVTIKHGKNAGKEKTVRGNLTHVKVSQRFNPDPQKRTVPIEHLRFPCPARREKLNDLATMIDTATKADDQTALLAFLFMYYTVSIQTR